MDCLTAIFPLHGKRVPLGRLFVSQRDFPVLYLPRWATGTGTPAGTKRSAYCCFLPDLTRFTGLHCAGPIPMVHPKNKSVLKEKRMLRRILKWRRGGFRPSIPKVIPYTRFPGVLLQPLGQLSRLKCLGKAFRLYAVFKNDCVF